jgi:hypothetical protein
MTNHSTHTVFELVAELRQTVETLGQLHPDGTHEEIYNGPGKPVWAWCESRIQKNGQTAILSTRLLRVDGTRGSATEVA